MEDQSSSDCGESPFAVPRDVVEAARARVRAGLYHSTDEVLTIAMQILDWAENDPRGKLRLLRFRIRAGADSANADHVFPGEEVARQMRERVRGMKPPP